MDNTNIILAANIQKFRKKCGLTQEGLAEKLNVSFQAVSKWETAKSAPDISFLPMLADIFGCRIDELFSRDTKTEIHYDLCTEFSWADDDIIRGVVCLGRKILQVTDGLTEKFTFEVIGDAKSVQSECNITVSGSVSGDCNAGNDLAIEGNLSGDCNAGRAVSVGGDLSGDINCGINISCLGNISGDIKCGGTITAGGDVEADEINGNVVCKSLNCGKISGDIVVKGED